MDGLNKLIELLNKSIRSEDFIDIAYGITEEIEGYENAYEAVEPIHSYAHRT
jgi:hypothetical protein